MCRNICEQEQDIVCLDNRSKVHDHHVLIRVMRIPIQRRNKLSQFIFRFGQLREQSGILGSSKSCIALRDDVNCPSLKVANLLLENGDVVAKEAYTVRVQDLEPLVSFGWAFMVAQDGVKLL